jgi:Tol biopolymer transport system component/DNA-binding winged helix-turn-helix (wHTH) protein
MVIRFGDFSADGETGELFRKGVKVRLQGQPFEILLILLGRPGKVVTREELRSKLWPSDTFVDFEHGLNAAVNRLREALADSADEPRFIETVPRKGYRFVGKVDDSRTTEKTAKTPPEPESLGSASEPGPNPASQAKSASAFAANANRSSLLRWSALLIVLLAFTAGTFLIRSWTKKSSALPLRTLTRVTFDPGLQIGATWSPDGRYLAFASNRGGKFDIWIQQISGGEPIQVTSGPAANWQPDWSPDGRYIAYRSEEGEGGIFIEPAIGGAGLARRVTSFGYYPRWSPDGSRILFQSAAFGLNARVFVVNTSAAESVQQIFPNLTSEIYVVSAAWHPDGKRVTLWGWTLPTPLPIFWTGPVNDPARVVKSELSSEVAKAVTEAAGNGYSGWGDSDFKVSWAPNGNELYFERMFRGARNIWKMRVDPKTLRGESIERITTGSGVETELSLSPDGNRLAFTSLSQEVRAWVFPINAARGQLTGPGNAVTNPGWEAWNGNLSRDGTKLAYFAKRAGRSEIWQTDLLRGTESLLVGDDVYTYAEPHWSRDGKHLAYVKFNFVTTDAQAFLIDANNRSEKPLTEPQWRRLAIWDWSLDGKSVLASADNPDTGRTEIWQIPTDTFSSDRKNWKLIAARPDSDLFQARFSPNGRWIAFESVQNSAQGLTSSIFLVPASGGEWTQLTDGLHWDDKPHWSPDGRMLYFLSGRSSFYNVFCVPVDPELGKSTGRPSQVTEFRDASLTVAMMIPDVEIDVTRDKLMVTTSRRSGGIWLLDHVGH